MRMSDVMIPRLDVEALGSVFLDVLRGITKEPDSPFIDEDKFQREVDWLAINWSRRDPKEASRAKEMAKIVKRMLGNRPVISEAAEALYFLSQLLEEDVPPNL
jgi:hypothetical protein